MITPALSGLLRAITTPILAGIFYIAPLKVQGKTLLKLAFALWLMGGSALLISGAGRLGGADPTLTSPMFMAGLTIAVALGLAKGKFMLSKTSQKNIERIQAFGDEPQSLFQVYSIRSWVIIEVMLLISATLTWFSAPLLIRGFVNVAVGVGLIISSLQYLAAIKGDCNTCSTTAA